MNSIMHSVRRFAQDESGVTAIEYGLIAGLIAVAIVVMVQNIGTSLNDTFTTINTKLTPPAAGG
jgi:pilus assembly protein Flp/PilA